MSLQLEVVWTRMFNVLNYASQVGNELVEKEKFMREMDEEIQDILKSVGGH